MKYKVVAKIKRTEGACISDSCSTETAKGNRGNDVTVEVVLDYMGLIEVQIYMWKKESRMVNDVPLDDKTLWEYMPYLYEAVIGDAESGLMGRHFVVEDLQYDKVLSVREQYEAIQYTIIPNVRDMYHLEHEIMSSEHAKDIAEIEAWATQGYETQDVVWAYYFLSRIYEDLNKGKSMCRKMLDMHLMVCLTNFPGTELAVLACNNYAFHYNYTEDDENPYLSERFYREALEIAKNIDFDDEEILVGLHKGLADCLYFDPYDQYIEEALDHYHIALRLAEKLGLDDRSTALVDMDVDNIEKTLKDIADICEKSRNRFQRILDTYFNGQREGE